MEIFSDKEALDFHAPKPPKLIQRVIEIATTSDSLVLDSFAGTGSTAHAVLAQNQIDGGRRNFIIAEMEHYADELTAERVRRVIGGYTFNGTQKTELLREKVGWRTLEKPNRLREKVEAIESLHGHEYDRIKKDVKDDELIVTGEKSVKVKTEGLGGSFTYCTLGDPVEMDAVLSGKNLPAYEALASVLFNTATGQAFDPAQFDEAKSYLGEVAGRHVWLLYRPDMEWLKSPDAALTLARAKAIADSDKQASHLVFAPARYVSQKMLSDEKLRVEFAPLPFALYRVERT
ncbi:type III restriction-modification system RcaSBIIP, Mod subunit [Aurantimonas sp. 22II-16-19i]|nr:type III restriction-modification system RcaSBIIP, Mod subunit [Aurantimonas sp. 22II-16-19i]